MRRLMIGVIVLVGLLVAADRAGNVIAERTVATTVQRSQHLAHKPDVDIAGFPFLTQLAAGKFGKVTLREQVQAGPCVADWVVLTPDASGLTESVYSVSLSQGRPDFFGHISRAS